jgi:serine/threonine-protein kinase
VAQSKIICPGCRTAFDADTNYCSRCGASLRATPTAARVRKTDPMLANQAPADDEDSGPRDPLLGRLIDGRYRVLERVGQGGMGVVYKVEHERMGKIAAMKVLHRDLAKNPEVLLRFRREAEAVSKLTSPHTVQTFDFGTADGALYLVMEYVRGDDLGVILRRDGPLPFAGVGPVFVQVCAALAEAHDLGIVHRDLKPENILVVHAKDGHDHAKVLDFGLAKLSARDDADVTGRGQIVGTPFYMAPEQIRGEDLDARTDIYALGAVLYRALTGVPPFDAKSPVGVLTRALTDELVAPSRRSPGAHIAAAVDTIVARAMARRRTERYPSADALRADLERALAGAAAPGGLARPGQSTSAHARLARADLDAYERSLRRWTWVRTLIIPVVVVGAAGVAVLGWRAARDRPQTEEREPNNDLASATLIAAGTTVHGTLGQRLTPDQGDHDYFRLATGAAPGRPLRLSAELEAIPNMDIALAVYDHLGKLLAVEDAGGIGDPEVLPNLGITDGTIYFGVLESRVGPPHAPTENLSDPYALTVRLEPPRPGEELEPNDTEATANPIGAGAPMVGTLARAADVDTFRFTGAAGSYEVAVSGAEEVTLVLHVGDVAEKGRRARVDLRPGTLIAIERAEELVPAGAARPILRGLLEPYQVTIRP